MLDFYTLSRTDQVTYIFQWLIILVASVGLTGNSLSFLIFSRKAFAKNSFTFYLRIKLLFDSYVLINLFRQFSIFMLNTNLYSTIWFFCKFSEYLVRAASTISLWLMTIVNFDRLTIVVFPKRFLFVKQRKFQIVLVCAVVLFKIITLLPLIYSYKLIQTNSTTSCEMVYFSKANTFNTNESILLIYGLNNILTGITIIHLFRSRKRAKIERNLTSLRDRKFAINSIAIDLICVFCKSPLLIIAKIVESFQLAPDVARMTFAIGVFCFTIENASSLFTNLFVNSMFYKEFLKLARIKKQNQNSYK